MPKYNIYKIKDGSREALQRKLNTVGLVAKNEKQIGEYTAKFYFSDKPDLVKIWWVDLYKDFLDVNKLPNNELYFGILLLVKKEICYAISFGKAHFYLREYCDGEFGLNLAERIVDENNLRIKNSKLFGGRRSKNITSYQDRSPIEYDSGESFQYIKAKTINAEDWGSVVSFGSSVLFNVKIPPSELDGFLDSIEQKLSQKPILTLPRVEEVKDVETKRRLDRELAISLISNTTTGTLAEEFSVSGVDFVFSENNQYAFFLKGNIKQSELKFDDLSLERLTSFVTENGIDLINSINDIRIQIKSENSRTRSESLKKVLDYVDDERYCLVNGKWHRFNQSYINFLQKEVDKIPILHHDTTLLPTNLKEDDFNKGKVSDGYLNFDKDFSYIEKYNIEKMDLYKDKTLYFVKMGEPQNLSYVIDQSLNTVKILQNNVEDIIINQKKIEPENMCLWLIFERKTTIKKLSDVRSLIFLMKLVEWKRNVIVASYKPTINIGYKDPKKV
ncbi:hypothetical protein BSK66_10230 [Paenibacillus odorifer]|uniref:Sporadically distributed protein, TIGR04141 family n=1 Tax=Paenibacillus odorifer TaxID=189426 RepID=A0A1R0XDW6_9BACL|nr:MULTISPECIES: DUF6119 family protein [Paenibacillus]ETT45398.1 hypothetical protein C171_31916 [Paenibacillus sp. FSL H8-237]OMD33236.1 hypothetical protein BJP51_12815 [Paenibacillus odorifer]OME59715.1 hypothetical protein BSK66_10230 [Paenibacillus odorifer]